MAYERQFLAGFDASGINPKFLPAAYGMFGQESSYGTASPNILQVTQSTAANPGYGVSPLPASDLNDPEKSSAFALRLLKAKADKAGLNFDNPSDYPSIMRLHNGGGDPEYVQHVSQRIPETIPEAPGGQQGEPMSGSVTQPPPAPQVVFQNAPVPQTVQDAADPRSRQNLAQMLLRAGAGFAGGRTFGEGLSSALGGVADVQSQQQQAAYDLYKQQQLAALYGLRADTANAGNSVKVGVAGAKNSTAVRNTDARLTTDARGQDLEHQDRAARLGNQQAYQHDRLALTQALSNAKMAQTAANTGASFTPVSAVSSSPAVSEPSAVDPTGDLQGPSLPPSGNTPLPGGAPPQVTPSTPSPNDPFSLPSAPVPGGLLAQRQFTQKNTTERDRYTKDHAGDLLNDQTLLQNIDQYQGAYDRLQGTALSYPGMGASWRIPAAAFLSGNTAGNSDAAELRKQHATLTMQLAGAKGRVLVAGLKTAGASLPDASVPYTAGTNVLRTAAANAALQQAVDQARVSLLSHNPNATPGQIESQLGQYVQGIGQPYSTGKDGTVTPRSLPSYEQWSTGSKSAQTSALTGIPAAASAYLRSNPQFAEAFDQKYGSGSAARILGK